MFLCVICYGKSRVGGSALSLPKYVLCRPTKLVADSKPSCVCKTDSSCPPRPAKGLSPLESQERFYASLPTANLEPAEDRIIVFKSRSTAGRAMEWKGSQMADDLWV